LEAAWPSLAPSKQTAGVAPEWVIRKISGNQALQEAPTGNWPAAMLSSGPQKLGEVVQRAPTGNFGPIALKSTAAPSGLDQKRKSPAKPVSVAAFNLERPRPPKLLEKLPTPVDASGESPGFAFGVDVVGSYCHTVLTLSYFPCADKDVDAGFDAEQSGKTSGSPYLTPRLDWPLLKSAGHYDQTISHL